MDWKSHLLFGLLSGAAVALLFYRPSAEAVFPFALISGASALLPDLDMRKSKASKVLAAFVFLAILAASFLLSYSSGRGLEGFFLFAALMLLALFGLDRLVRPRHRGIMHGLLFLFAVSLALLLIFGGFFAAAFAVGYFSHLLADFCVKLS